MKALSGGTGDFWSSRINRPSDFNKRRSKSKSSDSVEANSAAGFQFPLKQALTAGSLAFTGDTIAQLTNRFKQRRDHQLQSVSGSDDYSDEGIMQLLLNHDWLRALRMTSYGFLLYGPGSFAWYQQLDRFLPKPTMQNLMLKVLFNQIILGPSVIAVVFAWNNLWLGKLSELPKKYQKDALPTLLAGLRFWIPVSILNFWLIPLEARVAFMSMGSIFWNFCLSSTMSNPQNELNTQVQ